MSLLRRLIFGNAAEHGTFPRESYPTYPSYPTSRSVGETLERTYAHPWPDSVTGLGYRRVVTFSPCADCTEAGGKPYTVFLGATRAAQAVAITHVGIPGTWIAYGDRPLCLACARRRCQAARDAARGAG